MRKIFLFNKGLGYPKISLLFFQHRTAAASTRQARMQHTHSVSARVLSNGTCTTVPCVATTVFASAVFTHSKCLIKVVDRWYFDGGGSESADFLITPNRAVACAECAEETRDGPLDSPVPFVCTRTARSLGSCKRARSRLGGNVASTRCFQCGWVGAKTPFLGPIAYSEPQIRGRYRKRVY